jgi:glycosyltransferase involved in cell wall biosynthesis
MDVLLLAPVNPFDARDGHRMAVASDVSAVLDNRLKLGVISFLYKDQAAPAHFEQPGRCDARFFQVRGGSFPIRFMRGLFARVPPSSERLYSAEALAGVRSALQAWRPKYVIVDDVSMAGYIPLVREITPGAKVILRTHNVMQDVRREHFAQTKGLLRFPVGCDYFRYAVFEEYAMRNCDAHWAISEADASRMTALYGRRSDALSVSIQHERYTPIAIDQGVRNFFVHIGTLDFRRRTDLALFLRESWPKIRAAAPRAVVDFVGQLVGQQIDAPGATYSGPVKDDANAYRRGRFALNFQNTTGGIKLKTLTSLAAGRTLVSTPRGVEGLRLVPGEHYWDMRSFLSADHLADLIEDPESTRKMGHAGREWVVQNHSRAAIASQFGRLLGAA